jgi:hypothetical protein
MDKNDVGETIHALAHFLEKRLPELGLDFETYGAYILPLLTEEQVDEDEWTSVMELLQASSEIEEDTNSQQIWIDFRREIEQAWKDHCQQQAILEAQQHEERQRQIEEQIARDREFAAAAAASTLSTNDNHNDTTIRQHPPTDETEDSSELKKRALIERFGYDVPDDEEEGGGERTADDSSAPLTNRQVAKLAEMERAQQLRAHKGTTTKKEEQQKTAEAKRNKQQLKEERRKRATKGERKR